MQKKSSKSLKISISVIVLLILSLIATVLIVNRGLRLYETRRMFQEAEKNLQKGNLFAGGSMLLKAIHWTLEGGVRFQIADIYTNRQAELSRQGRLHEALEACLTGDRILSDFDIEDAYGHICYLIDFQIKNPALYPVQNPTSNEQEMP